MRRSASSASLASGKNISPLYHNPKDHYDEMGDSRYTDPETGHKFQTEHDLILYELLQGNRKYVKWLQAQDSLSVQQSQFGAIEQEMSMVTLKECGYLQQIEEERLGLAGGPLRPTRPKALVISCSRSFAPMDHIFGADPRALLSVRVAGYTCSAADSVIGSVEWALSDRTPPVLIVVGNLRNDIVATAVQHVMGGRAPHVLNEQLEKQLSDSSLLNLVMPAVHDAMQRRPRGTYEEVLALACEMNVWRTVETLLANSKAINESAANGSLRVVGALLDPSTGAVQLMGQHPSLAELIKSTPSGDLVRTADDAPVPAVEAAAMLYAGNSRYASSKGGYNSISGDDKLLCKLCESGQNPVSVVVGCADSRAPIEMLFDMRPGDLFVLRNAGNTCASNKGSLIGSAEYSITHLRTKVLVVMGHTKCGAVAAAIDAAHSNTDLSTVAGSIGYLLADIIDSAKKAAASSPGTGSAEQMMLATRINVFNTIEKLILYSDIVYTGVKLEELQVIGAMYDIYTGKIEWLGEHPQLEALVGRPMPMHEWHNSPYLVRGASNLNPGRSPAAAEALARLSNGNGRFVGGQWRYKRPRSDTAPSAIVLGGSEYRVPVEDLFDVDPGEIVVQRVLGSVAGMQERVAFSSIEYSVARWSPPVLLVLVESASPIIDAALQQLRGQLLPRAPVRVVLNHVMVSAMRATQEVERELDEVSTSAGKELLVKQLATELNCFYSMELLLRSPTIREKVLAGELELHGAIMESGTGRVCFLGEHPRQVDIINTVLLQRSIYKDGPMATLPREVWDNPFQPLDKEGGSVAAPSSPSSTAGTKAANPSSQGLEVNVPETPSTAVAVDEINERLRQERQSLAGRK